MLLNISGFQKHYFSVSQRLKYFVKIKHLGLFPQLTSLLAVCVCRDQVN